jgi:hypothetical protein
VIVCSVAFFLHSVVHLTPTTTQNDRQIDGRTVISLMTDKKHNEGLDHQLLRESWRRIAWPSLVDMTARQERERVKMNSCCFQMMDVKCTEADDDCCCWQNTRKRRVV